MGQCIGNCVKCTLVNDEEKVICCTFQTLRQTLEIRSELKSIKAMIEDLPSAPVLPESLAELCDAESPAAVVQEAQPSKKTKK